MNMKKLMNLNYLITYFVGAVASTQLTPYLKELGFDEVQKGILLSGIAVMTIFSQFISGYLCDKFQKMKLFFGTSFFIFVFISGVLFGFRITSFFFALLLVSVSGGFNRCWQGLLDTWSTQVQADSFSVPRAYGAVGWALGCWFIAILLNWFDFSLIACLAAVFSLPAFFLTRKIKEAENFSGRVLHISELKELLKNKQYIILVLICFVLFAMGTADIYLVVDKILDLGGTSFHVGLKWGFQSIMEAPVLLVGNKLMKKFKPIDLLLFASIMFGIRFTLYGFIQNPNWMIAAGAMQLVTFPIVTFTSKQLIMEIIDKKLQASAQMAAMSFYMGLSLLLVPLLTGFFQVRLGNDFCLFAVASLSAAAIILNFLYKKV